MKFIYRPEGIDPIEWDFRPGQLLSPESEAIEKVTGMYLPAWQEAAVEGSQRARRAFVWVMQKRQQPTLKFDQVQVRADEMDIVWEREELDTILLAIHRAREAGPLSEGELEALEAYSTAYEDVAGEPWQAPPSEEAGDDEPESPVVLARPVDDEDQDDDEAPKAG